MSVRIENLGEFNKVISNFGDNVVPEAHLKLQKKIALDLLAAIIERTPVGNPSLWSRPPPPGYVGGRAKGNWQVGLNSVRANETGRTDGSGGATLGIGVSKITSAQPFGIIWLYNNVPYITRLENGWSGQAPRGMLGLSVAEVGGRLA